jgi:hypothetical protein
MRTASWPVRQPFLLVTWSLFTGPPDPGAPTLPVYEQLTNTRNPGFEALTRFCGGPPPRLRRRADRRRSRVHGVAGRERAAHLLGVAAAAGARGYDPAGANGFDVSSRCSWLRSQIPRAVLGARNGPAFFACLACASAPGRTFRS